MNKFYLSSLISIIILTSLIPHADSWIPPTNSLQNIKTSNSTVKSIHWNQNFTFVGLNGLTVTGSDLSKSIYFSAPTGVLPPTTTCATNFGFVSYNQTSNILTCKLLNQTGSGGTVTSVSGTAGNTTSTGGNTPVINLGSNAVVTNGKSQNFTKSVNFTSGHKLSLTPSSTLSGLNIGVLTAPSILTPGDIWNIGTVIQFRTNVGTSVVLVDTSQVQAVKNKMFDTTDTWQDATDATKKLKFLLSGSSTHQTLTIATKQTTNQTGNVPNLVSTDTFFMQVAQNQTSDANAITNLPITNHHCATYFVTGNSTFRLICNFNSVVHVLSKG